MIRITNNQIILYKALSTYVMRRFIIILRRFVISAQLLFNYFTQLSNFGAAQVCN